MQKVFLNSDQKLFAKLTGNKNPAHLDPLVVRRMYFGRNIAHPMNLLLWALNHFLPTTPGRKRLLSLSADFKEPVFENTSVLLTGKMSETGQIKIRLNASGRRVAIIRCSLINDIIESYPEVSPGNPEQFRIKKQTLDQIDSAPGKTKLSLDLESAGQLFPVLMRSLPHFQIALLCAISRITGMVCPGFYALPIHLDLNFDADPEDKSNRSEMHFAVVDTEPRFSMVTVQVNAFRFSGQIQSIVTQPPVKQADVSQIKDVSPDEFKDQNALIIGGSRGLGEITAKILALGGADVSITYFKGKTEAENLIQEIKKFNPRINAVALDVQQPESEIRKSLQFINAPTHLYYFATPHIFSEHKGVFSNDLFQMFSSYYVTGFLHVFNAIMQSGSPLRYVFYPSSVSIDEIPLNMGAYSAAKSAGEMLCRFLQKVNSNIAFSIPRLPRMETDQTHSLLPVDNLDPLPIMLSELRKQ